MFDYLHFMKVEGERSEQDLKLFLLTTCTHCERAVRWLSRHGLSYSQLYADELSLEVKKRLNSDFHRAFHAPLCYPSLVVDERELLTGFEEIEWERALGPRTGTDRV